MADRFGATLLVTLDGPVASPAGAPVTVTLCVENAGAAPADLYLRGREITVDVVIARDGEPVWQRLANVVIPAVVQVRMLSPGEALCASVTCAPADEHGGPLPPGSYGVRASLLTEDGRLEAPERALTLDDTGAGSKP